MMVAQIQGESEVMTPVVRNDCLSAWSSMCMLVNTL